MDARWPIRGALLGAGMVMALGCGTPAADPDDDGGTPGSSSAADGPATSDTPPAGTTSDPGPMTGGATTNPGTTGMAEDGTTDDGPPMPPDLFNPPRIPDAPKLDDGPCGKVDFLFVIDNSGSMSEEQANLVASFPGFIAAIQSTLETVEEYHVGVTTTDAYSPNLAAPGCNVLGGLVVQTGGGNSSNAICGPYDDGFNYMTEADDLATAFTCAAQVGTSGNGIEHTMEALLNAIDPANPLSMAGGCNEGFLREDALLVLVIITDEYDGPGDPEGGTSPGTPMEWYDTVVAAKDGIPENVVVVSLVNFQDMGMGAPCPPGSTVFDGVNIVEFTNMFNTPEYTNGLVDGVCLPDYSPVFTEAVGLIDVACENFMPPA